MMADVVQDALGMTAIARVKDHWQGTFRRLLHDREREERQAIRTVKPAHDLKAEAIGPRYNARTGAAVGGDVQSLLSRSEQRTVKLREMYNDRIGVPSTLDIPVERVKEHDELQWKENYRRARQERLEEIHRQRRRKRNIHREIKSLRQSNFRDGEFSDATSSASSGEEESEEMLGSGLRADLEDAMHGGAGPKPEQAWS
mmetsp:Transcript_40096/g.90062  ORF Transcript_40096/g.90062 Transcript_40096/m.90062 type:complete len:200 (-) Transcript_40096:359-958(-)